MRNEGREQDGGSEGWFWTLCLFPSIGRGSGGGHSQTFSDSMLGCWGGGIGFCVITSVLLPIVVGVVVQL